MRNVKNAKTLLWLPALVLIIAFAYQPAWHGGILWDDTGHLTRSGLRSSSGGDRAGFHNDLGVAFARLGRRDEAIQQFRAAVELDPNNPAAQANLAKAMK